MQCIFLDGENCTAQHRNRFGYYKPEDETLRSWCHTEEFADCPRCVAFLKFLSLSEL